MHRILLIITDISDKNKNKNIDPMKFINTLLLTLAASVVSAAPTATDGSFAVPTEAILGKIDLAADEFPFLVSDGEHTSVVLLNSTVMDEAYSTVTKRDAEPWGWIRFFPGQPIGKREAEAEASPWGWIRFFPGQPIGKREADAEAEPWGWIKFFPGQPIGKRDAVAEPWGWIRFFPGQPIGKRED